MHALAVALDLHHFVAADLLTVLVLVVLEGLLSCDNAVVLALVVRDLPDEERGKALRYGIIGAYVFRIIALALATTVMRIWWLKVLGGLYLLYLAIHFFTQGEDEDGEKVRPVRRVLGLNAFWSTVVAVEFTDIIFSVDSIAAAVALSSRLWVLILGGMLGILAMRFAAQGFLVLLDRFPRLEPAAFVAVAVVGLKLMLEIPVDLVGDPVPVAPNYGTMAEYRAEVDRAVTPRLDLPFGLRINTAAPEPPQLDILRKNLEPGFRAKNPELPAAEYAEEFERALSHEHEEAEGLWNFTYRPLVHLSGAVSSALVLLVFAFGFIPRRAR